MRERRPQLLHENDRPLGGGDRLLARDRADLRERLLQPLRREPRPVPPVRVRSKPRSERPLVGWVLHTVILIRRPPSVDWRPATFPLAVNTIIAIVNALNP